LEGEGQVPVIKGDPRFNADGEEGVDDLVVEGNAGGVGLAPSCGKKARPRYREAKSRDVEVFEELDVLEVAVVEVAGDIAGFTAVDFAGAVDEIIPDGGAFAVSIPAAFYLVGGDGDAPVKVCAEVGAGEAH
jgi:hypothetical protein